MKTLQRDQFEAYFADSRRKRGAKKRPNFDTLSDGTYADDHTQRHWWTWQQARAACRAEALEEAAKVCFALGKEHPSHIESPVQLVAKWCAAAIRELK